MERARLDVINRDVVYVFPVNITTSLNSCSQTVLNLMLFSHMLGANTDGIHQFIEDVSLVQYTLKTPGYGNFEREKSKALNQIMLMKVYLGNYVIYQKGIS